MNRRRNTLVGMLVVITSMFAWADNEDLQGLQSKEANDWYIVRKDDTRHITTYAKQEDGKKLRSFKVEAQLDASLATLASIHFDVANIKKWYWETLESKLINKISDTEYVFYLKFKTPLAPDRDAVVKAFVEPYSEGHNFLVIHYRAVPSLMPVPANVTRVSVFDMDIKLTPMVNGQTQFDSIGYIDPSGDLPAWTVNLFQRQAPYATMLGLYRVAQREEYQHPLTRMPFRYME